MTVGHEIFLFSGKHPGQLQDPRSPLYKGYWGESDWSMNLATHLHLVLRLTKGGVPIYFHGVARPL